MTSAVPFNGTVPAQSLVEPSAGSRLAVCAVTFEAQARTHWHTHPCGQGLYTVDGCARIHIERVSPGDLRAGQSIWIPAGARHGHGANPNAPMTRIAYQEADLDGDTVHWREPVTDHTYRRNTQRKP